MIGGNKCILQDFICLLCVSKGAGGLSDDHLLFRMTWTDFENTLTVEADCTCRRLLLKVSMSVYSPGEHHFYNLLQNERTLMGLTAACQRDGHEVSFLSIQNEPRTWKWCISFP